MNDVGVLLGGEKSKVKDEMDQVFEFEKKLASIYEPKEKLRHSDKIYHKMTVEELQDLCPGIPWMDYINNMFNTPVEFNEQVVVYTPHYLRNMSDLVIRTERRTLANYMVWHLIKPMLPMLSKPFRELMSGMLKSEKGVEITDQSWRSCVKQTDSVFGFATGHLFVKEMRKMEKDGKEKVDEMIRSIRDAFIMSIPDVEWMDEETKQNTIQKVNSVFDMVGYPDWIEKETTLEEYYKNLTITNDAFKNYLHAREFYHQRTMNRRGMKVDRKQWHVTPTEVNAYYNSPNNYMAFPLGILQKPFFDPDFPMPLNFGAIGTIMGHELTHGFDSQGRYFDGDGNMKNWWSKETVKHFEERSKCFQEQYTNFSSSGQKIDGRQTLAENIADNGGLKFAFKAYKSWSNTHRRSLQLPALNLTSDQLFFVGFAQVWCSTSTVNNEQEKLLTDKHSPDQIRVLAAVSNSESFSKSFNCAKNSRMNLEKKCAIW